MAHFPKGVGGGGGLGLIFVGHVLLASQSPYLVIVYSGANIIIDPMLVTFGQICNFHDPNSVTFCFYELNNEEHFTFHLQYKHTQLVCLLTVNKKNSLTPKI